MRRLAVYGKGGIGKSTISANLSVALARRACRVLQIGCDPKHDSTRLLLHGMQPVTVLDYLRVTLPTEYDLSTVLKEGYAGIGCVEAGGPKPGVGCAGRGIISTFEMLEQFELDKHYDTILYDVLGDVVCGGFAVPIRREYADTVFIVSSGEFMSIYAANNILRGIRNYDGDTMRRVAGIIYNKRNVAGEDERMRRFAEAVHLPVVVTVPRDDAFAEAERANMTVMERGGNEQLCALFDELAASIVSSLELHEAYPLSDDELERAVLEGSVTEQKPQSVPSERVIGHGKTRRSETGIDLSDPNRYLSKTLVNGQPLHGCAFNGAISTLLHLRDATVVAHAPASCVNLSLQTFTSSGRRTLFERGVLLPASLSPHLVGTRMTESEIVFGGTDLLLDKVRSVQADGPSAIVVVSSCPAGIIGDDVERAQELSTPDCPVLVVKTDGNMSGDYLQGSLMSYLQVARHFMDRDVQKVRGRVNILAEKLVVTNTQSNYETMAGYLKRMGLEVGCRFLYDTTTQRVRDFCTAELTLPAYGDYTARMLGSFLSDEFGVEVFDRAFPVGFDETVQWLEELGKRFDALDSCAQIVVEAQQTYEREIQKLRPMLAGKRLMVVTYNCELDWILKTALDLDMRIVRIGLLDYSQDEGFRTRLSGDLPLVENYARDARAKDIEELQPDVLLTNYASSLGDEVPVADTIPMCPEVGFFSGLALAKRWARLLKLELKGEWHEDGHLFEQSFL